MIVAAEALDVSVHGPSDFDDQHDYDSVASDEDADQEPLRSANAGRNNRARVRPLGRGWEGGREGGNNGSVRKKISWQ